MNSQLIPSNISIIDYDGGKWLTAEQLGLALGFSKTNARDGVGRLYRRHVDEFSEKDSVTVKLTATDGKAYETRIFSHTGCNLLSFFANTPNAKAFRAWAKEKLAEPVAASANVALLLKQNQALKTELARLAPRFVRIAFYHNVGLDMQEMRLLTQRSDRTVRRNLQRLDACGFTEYRPDPYLSALGKLGNLRKRQNAEFIAAQQTLGLEG